MRSKKKYELSFCRGILFLLLFGTNTLFAQVGSLEKAVDLSTATSGQNLKYTLQFGCSSLDADCEGAILVDTLPPEVEFVSATYAIVAGSAGNTVINPVYDPTHHTVTWDFRTIMPEMGLPDGSSGAIDIIVNIVPGVTPSGISITNNAILITDNAGVPAGTAETTTDNISPAWTISKSNISGTIYHDMDVTYQVQVCPDGAIGNVNLLPGAVVTDDLPPGAVFVSATAGGVHDSGTPGQVTWTFLDTLKVTDPCEVMEVVVQYPSTDLVNNNTGTSTSIPKLNTADLGATSITNEPVMESDGVTDPLEPPFFAGAITKDVATENGATPVGTTNKFMIGVINNSTQQVDSFILSDNIPPQADLVEIQLEQTLMFNQPFDVRVQLNNSGVWINFINGAMTGITNEYLVTTIPGWMPGTSYVSAIEYDFGTVPSGFSAEAQLIFEPSYPLDNNGNPTDLNIEYTNTAELNFQRPQDGMNFMEMADETFCVVASGIARLEPTKTVEPNYVTTPAGDATTGNPYFMGSRVKFTLHVENDGADAGDDAEITADSSEVILLDPIAADLLPTQFEYELSSYTIVNNNSSEVFDNSGTNPTFELVDDFNGTGKTLLRWIFDGELEPGESFDICFNATIRDTVVAGREVTNNYALTSPTNLYCAEGDCSVPTTDPQANDYFGTTADPSVLLPGISEMCVTDAMITVADSISVPFPTKVISNSGPYGPSESPAVDVGLATDTVAYQIGICNHQAANFTLPDPVLVDLLPAVLTYVPGTVIEASNNTGIGFSLTPNAGTNPVFEVIDDFGGTGRQLLRWSFTGDFPINACVEYEFKNLIARGSGGEIINEPYATASRRSYECVNGVVVDTYDVDGDGESAIDGDELCRAANTTEFIIPEINALGSQKYVKGVYDPTFLTSEGGTLAVGTTEPDDSVTYRIRVFNAGNEVLTDASVIDIFPYIDDIGVQLTSADRESEWAPSLTALIMSPDPNIEIYYSDNSNPCRPEMNPQDGGVGCVNDWTTTPDVIEDVKAVKFDFVNLDIAPAEEYWFDIYMKAPDTLQVIGQNGSPGIAWNSIARNANEVPAQEPNKVGILIEGYDVALRKTLASGQSQYVSPGENVDYTLTIVNQSSHPIQNITITDYYPSLFSLNDGNWSDLGGGKAERTINQIIAENDSMTVSVRFMVEATAETGDIIDNFAEISDFEDLNGNHPPDWDSVNDDTNNDAGGQIDSDADDATFGNGQGTVGDGVALTDEDDHDGARVYLCSDITQNVAADQYVCTDDLTEINNIVVPTNAAVTETIQFVYFNSAQTGTDMYTGGTVLDNVMPSGGNATLDGTLLPTAVGSYHVYAILNPTPADMNCRPNDYIFYQMNPPVVADIQKDSSICPGFSAPIVSSATGGTGVYTYAWDNGLPTNSSHVVNPSTTTTYNVTITDSGGNCVDTESVIITVLPEPTVDAGMDIDTCLNSVVTLEAIATGGTPIYTFEWSNGANTATQMPVLRSDSTFFVTVTDDNGCRDTSEMMVTVFDEYGIAMIPDTCRYDLGELTVTAIDGVPTYTYNWSNGETTQTISNLQFGIYTVTVSDSDMCSFIDSAEVTLMPCTDFDLALKKVVTSTGPYQPGDDVDYTISIYNQGDISATDVVVRDYIPTGMALNDPIWTEVVSQVGEQTIPFLGYGDSTTLTIRLRISSGFNDTNLINNAEIISANGGIDDDSPLSNVNNGASNELATDDNIDDDFPGTPGVGDNPSDEDDYDPALIEVICPDRVNCLPVQIQVNEN